MLNLGERIGLLSKYGSFRHGHFTLHAHLRFQVDCSTDKANSKSRNTGDEEDRSQDNNCCKLQNQSECLVHSKFGHFGNAGIDWEGRDILVALILR